MVHQLTGLIVLAAACSPPSPPPIGPATDSATPTDDTEPAWEDLPFTRTIATLQRDASGRTAEEAGRDTLCPTAFDFVGEDRGREVCVGEEQGSIVLLDRDEWGSQQDDADEASRCDPLGPHLGGLGRAAVCQIQAPLPTMSPPLLHL